MSDPTAISLGNEETEQIITDAQAQEGIPYLVEVTGNNPVRYSHQKLNADRGVTLSAGQTHTLSNFRSEGIWINAFAGSTSVRVRPAGADLQSQPERNITVAGGSIDASRLNRSSVHTESVTGSSPSSQSVPDGFDVIYRSDPANASTINIGNYPLQPGEAVDLGVSNVDVPSVSYTDPNDTLHIIVES